jgi:hypothetical protein
MAACRFAQEAAPLADDLIGRMFPSSVLGVVLWGEGQVRIEWLPDGTVNHWVSRSSDRRLASALEQVHWCEFPHPRTFGLPNRAVVVDFQVTRGRLLYRMTPA